jgi:hypothetical protein
VVARYAARQRGFSFRFPRSFLGSVPLCLAPFLGHFLRADLVAPLRFPRSWVRRVLSCWGQERVRGKPGTGRLGVLGGSGLPPVRFRIGPSRASAGRRGTETETPRARGRCGVRSVCEVCQGIVGPSQVSVPLNWHCAKPSLKAHNTPDLDAILVQMTQTVCYGRPEPVRYSPSLVGLALLTTPRSKGNSNDPIADQINTFDAKSP